MHLDFVTRGIKHERDLFVSMMQSQFFQWKRVNAETGQTEITAVQGSLRPVELWEYVFPEEAFPEVCAMLNIKNVKTTYKLAEYKMAMLRKALQLQKMPIIPEITPSRIIKKQAIAIHPIGIKYDPRRIIKGKEGEDGKIKSNYQETL